MMSIAKNLMLVLFAAAWLSAGADSALAAGGKIALVIGNGHYRQQEPLPTAPRDAGAIANALRALGFEVIQGSDLNNGGFRAALNTFSERMRRGDLALFYFMGHAVQVNGRNFLLPIGTQLRREFDLLTQGVATDAVRHLMRSSGARVSVILLDASYPNRLASEQAWAAPGLAAPGPAGSDMLIAYAGQPGSEVPPPGDQGSLFAQSLEEALKQDDVELVSALDRLVADVVEKSAGRQRPWIAPSITSRVALGRGAAAADPVATPEPAPSAAPASEDVADEPAVKEEVAAASDAEPQEADQQASAPSLAEIKEETASEPEAAPKPEATPEPEPTTEPETTKPEQTAAVPADQPEAAPEPEPESDPYPFDTALTAAARGQIQRDLKSLGLYGGGIDQDFGPGTRRGIKRLQAELGEEATGYLTEPQTAALAERAAAQRAAALEQQKAAQAQEAQAQEKEAREEEEAARPEAEEDTQKQTQVAVQPTRKLSEVERLTAMAEQGDAKAQAALGVRYFHGRGVAKDYEKARFWYLEAAKLGEASAQTNLGFIYFNGYGVKKDVAEAAKWLRAAAQQGQPEAQLNLGLLYENGSGVAQSYAEAAKWYDAAAKRGMAEAGQRLQSLKSRNLIQ